ncbi:MAG: hypothetical protein FWF04_05790, partial [Clostridiales bacterium]|nr:hypothetical protein [Clostridiales bacterium]
GLFVEHTDKLRNRLVSLAVAVENYIVHLSIPSAFDYIIANMIFAVNIIFAIITKILYDCTKHLDSTTLKVVAEQDFVF